MVNKYKKATHSFSHSIFLECLPRRYFYGQPFGKREPSVFETPRKSDETHGGRKN